MRIRLIGFVLSILFLFGCGSASAPTSPAQPPSNISFTGIKIADQIVTQMDGTLTFEADADATDVLTTFTDGLSGETVTDGSCGSMATDGVNLTLTAYSDYVQNKNSECIVNFSQNSTDLGSFTYRTTLSEERAETMTFSSQLFTEYASDPDVDIYNGDVYVCYRSLGSPRQIYVDKTDYGISAVTTSTLIEDSDDYYSCVVRASGDNVALIANISGDRDLGTTNRNIARFSSDSGATFGDHQTEVNTEADSNSRADAVWDENGVLHVYYSTDDSMMIVACTSSSCGTPVAVADGTAIAENTAGIAYQGSGGLLHVVWSDTRYSTPYADIMLAELRYADSTYTVVKEVRLSSVSETETCRGSSIKINRPTSIDGFGDDVVTWAQMDIATYSSNVMMVQYDSDTSTAGSVQQLSDIESSLLPAITATFVTDDNYYHFLYIFWGESPEFEGGGLRYTMGNYADDTLSLIPSLSITIDNYNYQKTVIRNGVSSVGRSYIVFDTPTYTEGSLTDSDIYFAIGAVPES